MTIQELELLNRSMQGLGDTFQQNRLMRDRNRQWETEREDRVADRTTRADLDRKLLGLREQELQAGTADREDARANRKLSLEAQQAHQQRLEAISKEQNETRRQQMYLEFLGELNKTGQLTDDGLAKMEEAFNKQFGAAGLGVKLFRKAEQPGKPARVTQKMTLPGSEEPAEVTREMSVDELQRQAAEAASTPKPDSLTKAKLAPLKQELAEQLGEIAKGDQRSGFLGLGGSREARVKELQKAIAELEGVGQPGKLVGPEAPAKIKVVAPDGRVGLIPADQLQRALQEGYKRAE